MNKILLENKRFDFRLMATDMDGTLLKSDGKISDTTILSIKKVVDSGKFFILSSGRPLQAVTKYLSILGLEKMPFIIYNGAKVVYNGKVVFDLKLCDKDVELIVNEGERRSMTMICWADDKLYANVYNDKVQRYKRIGGIEPIIVDDLSKINDVTKIVWYGSIEETKRYHKEMSDFLSGKVNVHPTRVDFLEFVNKDCSKGVALKIVCDLMGVDVKNAIAIGDGFNDIPMIELAGLGVAVGNADQKVKDKADLVAETCDDLGVEKIIEKFLI